VQWLKISYYHQQNSWSSRDFFKVKFESFIGEKQKFYLF